MIPFYFACIYWGGVGVNAFRIRSRTGKTPALRPMHRLDYLLFSGWFAVIVLWFAAPWIAKPDDYFFASPMARAAGISVAVAGILGTWWCYATLGNAWAISQDKGRTTKLIQHGPYRLARHPIYLFQWLVVLGMFLAAPGIPLTAALVLLSILMPAKAKVEERGLDEIFAGQYAEYSRRVGPFFPKFGG